MSARLLLLPALLALTSCDPFARRGTFNVDYAPSANLSAEAADPVDLLHGRGADTSDAVTAAAAVDRARTDKVKSLPMDSGFSTSGSGGGGGGGGS